MSPLVKSDDFPLTKKCAYINAANVALMPKPSIEAINKWHNDVGVNGSNNFNDLAEDNVFEGLRAEGARLFNCSEDDIAGGSSYTELLASIAWAVMPSAESNVVSTDIVFPSTIFPWTRVSHHTGCEIRFVHSKGAYTEPGEIIKSIDKNTAVVSISHAEYTSGQLYDLKLLADHCHENGALLIVDATQSAGAVPIDGPGSGADVIISGSYKWLCGPFGAAVMYLAPYLQNKLEPGIVGFRSHAKMWDLSATRLEYPDTAKKFEASTMAFGCIKGLETSMQYLNDIGIDRIYDYNIGLADKLIEGLQQLNIKIVSPKVQSERTSIVTCHMGKHDAVYILDQLKVRGVIAHKRQDYVRFAPHLYNNIGDIERAIYELGDILG
tara:strand:+ start:5644 stop:6786 length:1143 start_codon:yes stop_codon:yes gene_type:complete